MEPTEYEQYERGAFMWSILELGRKNIQPNESQIVNYIRRQEARCTSAGQSVAVPFDASRFKMIYGFLKKKHMASFEVVMSHYVITDKNKIMETISYPWPQLAD